MLQNILWAVSQGTPNRKWFEFFFAVLSSDISFLTRVFEILACSEGEFFFVFQKEEQYVDSDLAYGEYVAPAGYEADDENDGLIY